MRWISLAVLYTALALGANAGFADTARLEALRQGDMKKLVFWEAPQPVSDQAFTAESGGKMRLADLRGKYLLVNFWATWCAPCRKEMPSLEALHEDFGGDRFAVVTIATGRNSETGIRRFFEEVGVEALPRHTDPKSALARDMAVLGLPISVLIDPEGREIARLRGDADWNSESARAIVTALIGAGG